LHFELASGIASVAAGKLFDKVALDLVDAIVTRAGQQLEQHS
jgi:ribosome-associated toxin RatA of RatAB toxin-antitoxin module